MPADEANEYMSKIQHEENIPICQAVLGRIDKDSLEENARQTFEEFQRWSANRTQRVRNEQWTARRRREETRMAINMTRLHERGVISDQTLLMYGISGELPERRTYMGMSSEEKERLWAERLEARLGPNWSERFSDRNLRLPIVENRRWFETQTIVNWRQEGF
jgi:hypothetical protein